MMNPPTRIEKALEAALAAPRDQWPDPSLSKAELVQRIEQSRGPEIVED